MDDLKILAQIQTNIEETVDRYKSILTIPRLNECLVEDLELVLSYVKENGEVFDDQLTNKIIEIFKVSQTTARNVRPTLERANLLMKNKNKKIKLTKMSEGYYKTKDIGYLSKGFINNYFGFLEVLYLIQKNKPIKRKEIFNDWENLYKEEFGQRVTITNKTQFYRIFIYLTGLNLITEQKGKIVINSKLYLNLELIQYW